MEKNKTAKEKVNFFYLGLLGLSGGLLFWVYKENLFLIFFKWFVIAILILIILYYSIKKSFFEEEEDPIIKLGLRDPMQLTPVDYERFCGILLKKQGWNVSYTKGSNDFGADIIADNGDIKGVFQCKRWANPVGIRAVQEIYSAINWYHASFGVVVSVKGYTPRAKSLASKTRVKLLRHEDLLNSGLDKFKFN